MAKEGEKPEARKRAEEALRESHESYKELADSIADVFFAMDKDLRYTYWNKASEDLAGISAKDAIGKSLYDLFPDTPQTRRAEKVYLDVLRTQQPQTFVNEYQLGGKDFVFEISAYPSRDGLSVFVKDITERKRAEEALQESEEAFRLAFENAKDAIFWADPKTGIITNCNEAAESLLEKERNEIIGYPQTMLHPPRKAEHYAQMFKKHIEEEGAVDDEAEVITKSGKIKPVHITASVTLVGGKPIIQGIFRDITERKRAEEELIRLSSAVKMSPDSIVITDLEGRIIDVNQAALKMYGTDDKGDLIGTYFFDLIAPEQREKALAAMEAILEKGYDRSLGYHIIIKDGSRVPVEMSAAVMKDLDGKPIGLVGISRDITERKQAEEEIRRRSEQLAALNAIAMTVTSTLDLQEVLRAVQETVMKLLGEKYAPLFALFNERNQTFEVVLTGVQREPLRRVEKLLGAKFEELHVPLSTMNPAVREAVLAGKPYVTGDGSDLLGPLVGRRLVQVAQKAMGVESIVDLPLSAKGKLVGTMVLFSQKEKIPDEEMELLSAIANQAAIAIENARLYEQTDEKLRDRVAELTALNTIAESLASTLELDEMLQSIVTRVAQVMEARICTIRLVEDNKLTIGAAVGYRDESSRQHTIEIDERLARIVRDQQPLLVEDLWESEPVPPSRQMRAWREEVHSFLGVPMISKGETIGVLSIYGEEPHHFAQEEVRLLSTIANQAAIAIENARPYERVREHAEELERLVQERTRELRAIHAEWLKSAKLAALGQLAAGVAHELNNPLGAISGYLELLQEEMELEPPEMKYMERIEKNIQQATKIVRELRSTWIPSEPAWQIVGINDILEETFTSVERRLSLHQIKVQKEMTPNLPQIHADPDRLQQVFINLITNARQAMAEGGTLGVVSRESRNGEWVEIIFADTGEGIAEEHLDKIFDPFFTTRSPGKGMGLGLSVSHRHIRDHGGAIDFWSEKGRGTVFRVALPPSGAQRCWEILDCDEKERCKAVRENADYRCWSVFEDASRCERCEVYRRKALLPLDGTLLPE